MSLSVGFCVYEYLFLNEEFPRAPQSGLVFLKWPNDLVYEEGTEIFIESQLVVFERLSEFYSISIIFKMNF